MRRLWAATGIVMLLFVAVPAWAGDDGEDEGKRDDNNYVLLTGRAVIPEGETYDNVVVFDGPVTVDGEVLGTVVGFNGPMEINGSVEDHVISFDGRVTVNDGATIGGDVRSRLGADVDPGAEIGGDVKGLDPKTVFGPVTAMSRFWVWLAVSVSTAILGLLLLWLARPGLESAAARAKPRVGASLLWGLGLFLGLPILSVLLLVTILGIP